MLGLDGVGGDEPPSDFVFAFAQRPGALLTAFSPKIRDGEQRGTGACLLGGRAVGAAHER